VRGDKMYPVLTPQVQYTTGADGVDIAWTEFGKPQGPRLVFVPGFVSHLELNWESPPLGSLLRGLGSVCRVVTFDKRGTGLSGRHLGFGSLAERADDARAVMDAAGWDRAHLFGISEGGPMSILFATSHPSRVESLSLYGTFAVAIVKPDSPDVPELDSGRKAVLDLLPDIWGNGTTLSAFGLIAHGDEAPEGMAAHFERNTCTPHMIVEILRRNWEIDVRPLLSAVHVPTLVVHAAGDPVVAVVYGRHLAQEIHDARYVEVPLSMHLSFRPKDYEPILDAVLDFVAGTRPSIDSERVLATIMLTDIVDSTRRAAEMGDGQWRIVLDEHDLRSQRQIARFGGEVVRTTGDGTLAIFDGPTRAVQCALHLRDDLESCGVPIRTGLHTGEIELRTKEIGGLAVHIAARISALADESEVLVSRTVHDLAVGSGLLFDDRGSHELKGVPEHWQIFAAESLVP
jgi:class 3 adenylate cyclase